MTEASELDVLRPAAAPALPAPLPAAAVERLPRGELGIPELDADPFWRLVAAFLVDCRREQTRRAYFNDLRAWYAWCTDRELHPLQARRHDIALWARQLADTPAALRQGRGAGEHRAAPVVPVELLRLRPCRSACSRTTRSPTSSAPASPTRR